MYQVRLSVDICGGQVMLSRNRHLFSRRPSEYPNNKRTTDQRSTELTRVVGGRPARCCQVVAEVASVWPSMADDQLERVRDHISMFAYPLACVYVYIHDSTSPIQLPYELLKGGLVSKDVITVCYQMIYCKVPVVIILCVTQSEVWFFSD